MDTKKSINPGDVVSYRFASVVFNASRMGSVGSEVWMKAWEEVRVNVRVKVGTATRVANVNWSGH